MASPLQTIEQQLADARRALECWQTYAALAWSRAALEAARAARLHAEASKAELLLRRAELSLSPHPERCTLPLGPNTPELEALRFRFACERALACATVAETPPASLHYDQEDAVAAWVLCQLSRKVSEWSACQWVPEKTRSDQWGWFALAEAISAEARGSSSAPALERAYAGAQASDARSVSAALLCCKIAICAERRAFRQERAHRLELVDLIESWALELRASDAAAALARPDRVRASGSELSPVTGDARLVRVALQMSEETNLERLAELALLAALEESGAERGALVLRDSNGRLHAAKTRVAAEQLDALVGFSTTIANQVLDTGEVLATNDVSRDARLSHVKSLHFGVTSVLCVPAKSRALIEGAIYLDRDGRGRPFDEAIVASVTAIGSMLAASMATRRALSELESKAEELALARADLARHLAVRTDEVERLEREVRGRRGQAAAQYPTLIGSSASMARLRDNIARFASSDAPVYIAGETGTGKELVARALHHQSARAAGPFVAVNCGAFSESLLEAELFGAERGAYTGATSARQGLFEAADGGTLLLDEVGDMPAAMQVALLRVLESSEIRRVGSTRSQRVNVRILSASHKDLAGLVGSGKFRADLRYRLEVVRVDVPPLRDRMSDLPELVEHLLGEVNERYRAPRRTLARAALTALMSREYPGNVRELRHVLTSAALTARSSAIEPADLPTPHVETKPARTATAAPHEARAENIREALRQCTGHRGRAAELLGISRATLYRHLELYAIDPSEFEGRAKR